MEGHLDIIERLNAEIDQLRDEVESLSIKLQRTVNAAYHALLEMSAWLGVPEEKRHAQIDELMGNVKYCAEHDLRHVDQSQQVQDLKAMAERLAGVIEDAIHERYSDDPSANPEGDPLWIALNEWAAYKKGE